jgi:hypothetical protein
MKVNARREIINYGTPKYAQLMKKQARPHTGAKKPSGYCKKLKELHRFHIASAQNPSYEAIDQAKKEIAEIVERLEPGKETDNPANMYCLPEVSS